MRLFALCLALALFAAPALSAVAAAASAGCVSTHAEWARRSAWPVLPQSLVCPDSAKATWGAALAEAPHDAWGRLAAQWVAAQLNAASTRDTPPLPHIHNTLLDARALLAAHCVARGSINVAHAGTLTSRLEAYNTGKEGVASCVAPQIISRKLVSKSNGGNDNDNDNDHHHGGNNHHHGGHDNDDEAEYSYDDETPVTPPPTPAPTPAPTPVPTQPPATDDDENGGGHHGHHGGHHGGGGGGDDDEHREPSTILTWYVVFGLIAVFLVGRFAPCCGSTD